MRRLISTLYNLARTLNNITKMFNVKRRVNRMIGRSTLRFFLK